MWYRFIALPVTCLMCLLLAACAHTDAQAPTASRQYTLAILPWNVDYGYYSGRPPFEVTMDAFEDALARSAFVPVFSYYDLDQRTTTIKKRPGIENVWAGRSVTSDPDHRIAFQLGEELGVDAVITYAVLEKVETDHMYVYLFDVSAKRVHSNYNSTGNFTRDASVVLTGMTRYVFAKFLKNRKTSS